MERTYTVTLADGTAISGLKLNGNNFISGTEVPASLFDGNCAPTAISDGENTEVHDNMELVQSVRHGNEWWFILRDIPETEMAQKRLRSDIEYIAMMSGVEL